MEHFDKTDAAELDRRLRAAYAAGTLTPATYGSFVTAFFVEQQLQIGGQRWKAIIEFNPKFFAAMRDNPGPGRLVFPH